MHTVRPTAVAGTFYAAEAAVLAGEVRRMLGEASQTVPALPACPKALIAPHAGYVYSGQTAAAAYATLLPWRASIRRVVLLGPVHRVPVRGLALPGAQAFATPLGEVAVDQAAALALEALPQVVTSPAAHAQEHALEVQLPFLQVVLPDFEVLPLAVGDATPTEVAEVLDVLWGGPETLIVISSDLSHFLRYDAAQAQDRDTVQHILHLQASLHHQQACGGTPINGLLLSAARHHLQPRLLGMCNSGDTAGDMQRVVGYASLAFLEEQGGQHGPH